MPSPRDRMVASAALLIRERGAQSTAIADVLAHSGAPRGSAYHYFPGGRTQLLCEAVDYVADFVAARMAKADSGIQVLDGLARFYRKNLLETDYRAGCPILAVAVEAGEAGKDNPVLERAAATFARWNDLITQRLIADGFAKERAEDLAVSMTAGLEGAIVLARAARDTKPLDIVHRQLRDLLEAE
ncbi:TetR/AcrR family transcriptional regulator [Mycolicibacterium helvum]|uniref:Transcriptional regulator n=1 Tax=Mycolicibacterium helvum TaxID=1534349 RepID=A0A7I7T5T8_9MYCO|nr:TetR/AcrR family transcriptional regulator [Mycolicibacterium helvum]BBY63871.1 transcriptional regulator [Mycolicibacterium helvum]